MNGDDIVETRIQKWGNSSGIRIPSSILKSLNIKTNDILNIEQEEDKIIISIPKKKKISLEDKSIPFKLVLIKEDCIRKESLIVNFNNFALLKFTLFTEDSRMLQFLIVEESKLE